MEEHASIFGLTQDRLPVLRIYYRVFLDELFGWCVQVSGERLDIAAGHVHAGFSATVGASLAIDLLLHLTSDPAKQMIGNMVRFEKPPKAEVLSRIRFRETADLDEVGDHASSILPPARGGRSSLRQRTATAPRPVFNFVHGYAASKSPTRHNSWSALQLNPDHLKRLVAQIFREVIES